MRGSETDIHTLAAPASISVIGVGTRGLRGEFEGLEMIISVLVVIQPFPDFENSCF